jgi:cystathionine beta-lyase/cystathionine gamma-synthase
MIRHWLVGTLFLRLSTGIESVDDLIADFEPGLQNYSAPMRTEDT